MIARRIRICDRREACFSYGVLGNGTTVLGHAGHIRHILRSPGGLRSFCGRLHIGHERLVWAGLVRNAAPGCRCAQFSRLLPWLRLPVVSRVAFAEQGEASCLRCLQLAHVHTIRVPGSIAQFERELMLERQREVIAKANAEKKYKGRKPIARAKANEVVRLAETDVSREQIAKELGIGIAK